MDKKFQEVLLFRVQGRFLEQVGHAQDAVQGGAEFMADLVQKVGFEAVQVLVVLWVSGRSF